jgi:hypothetical protein
MTTFNLIKRLTPEQAWEMFVPNGVELFISFFHADAVTNIEEMCFIYARDSLNEIGRPYTLEQQTFLATLFLKHIKAHIEKIGGYDKLELYTVKEVEAIEDKSKEDMFKALEDYKKSRSY